MMALGAIQSLQKAKRKDVLVAGFDALDEAKKAVREGTLQVTVDQQAAAQGYLGIVQALDRIRGANPSRGDDGRRQGDHQGPISGREGAPCLSGTSR